MNSNYSDTFNRIFDEKEPSMEELQDFFNQSLTMLKGLEMELTSPDEKTQEAALESTIKMQTNLEEKIQELCKKSGIDLDSMLDFTENGIKEMSGDEQELIAALDQRFEKILGRGN